MMKNVNQQGYLFLEKKYGEIKVKKFSVEFMFFFDFFGHFLLFMKEGIYDGCYKFVNKSNHNKVLESTRVKVHARRPSLCHRARRTI